jgi:SnoaL-like domain
MKPETNILIQVWFDGLNRGDYDRLLQLFGDNPVIRNAANPVIRGPEAPQKLLKEFFDRTSTRRFKLVDAAEGGDLVFATWEGELTFRKGIRIADVNLPQPLRVSLRGVDRFRLDRFSRIAELDIIHETTSVVQAARQAAT